ncbi:MAG: esterase [Planctomycetota bacterium]|nr:MAG: esterase [Planctomycetota bacterium]
MDCRYERDLPGGSRLSLYTHHSQVLRGNPLGDPHVRQCPLLMPKDGASDLPLVLILVGFTGTGPRVMNVAMWSENLPERLDRLTAEGKLPPAVYLWPSCETRYGGSQYMNSPATGAYEDHLLQELVPSIEGQHGCGGADGRIVIGKSSGGYGALTLAMRNPGFFAAAGSHAGDMGFEYGYFRDFPAALNVYRQHGGPQAFLEALPNLNIGTPEIHAIDVLAMASCYSPNLESDMGVDLPFDLETGEPDQEVFARWLQHDPLHMVFDPEKADALRGLKALYLDAGERDEFALQWGLRRLLPRLRDLEIAHHAEFFDGGHFNMDFRYEVSLPRLFSAL